MYSTGYCPYCQRAEQLLERKGVTDLNKIMIDEDGFERDTILARTGQRTVPQIFAINQRLLNRSRRRERRGRPSGLPIGWGFESALRSLRLCALCVERGFN
jgi:glutaredoxin